MAVIEPELAPAASLVAENITRLKPYIPGKPIEQVQKELGLTDVIKLASNESARGPSPRAIAAIQEAAAGIAIYPDGSAPILRAAVAQRLSIPEETLIFGNGSDELLLLLCQTFLTPGVSQTVQAHPSFAMYEIYPTLVNAQIIKVPLTDYTHDLDAMADAITPRTKIVFIANPNNPTGTFVARPAVERFLNRLPEGVIAVFDEAYGEYVEHPDPADLIPCVLEGRNIVVTRTFSKAYALAGVRVGYAIARPEIIGYLNRARSPFNVNILAQAGALAAWNDPDHLAESVRLNLEGKHRLYASLKERGLGYIPSEANFVLIDVRRDSRAVFEALMREGVIVRPGAGLGLPQHIRVTIGTPAQMAQFLEALDKVLG